MTTGQREKKYHISINNEVVECHAYVRPCPRGGASQHFSSMEKAMAVADRFNENHTKSKFEMCKLENGTVVLSAESKRQFRELSNANLTIIKMNNTISAIKEKMRQKLVAMNLDSLQTPYGKLRAVAETQTSSVDSNMLKADGIYDENSKESMTKGHMKFEILNDRDEAKKNSMTKAEDVDFDFNIVVDKDTGEYKLDEESLEALKSLYDLDQINKRAKENYDEIRSQLYEEMGESNIPNIKFGNTIWERVPDYTRRIVDTKLLKEKKLYDKYVKTNTKQAYLAITWDKGLKTA